LFFCEIDFFETLNKNYQYLNVMVQKPQYIEDALNWISCTHRDSTYHSARFSTNNKEIHAFSATCTDLWWEYLDSTMERW